MATADEKPVRPTAAVARHLEWLDFALAAARDEEVRRQGRLERATDKNREKRAARLAEVSAEVRELDALVGGLRTLQARGAARTTRRTSRTSFDSTKTGAAKAASAKPSPRRRTVAVAASSDGAAVTTSAPASATRAAKPVAKTAKPAAKEVKPAPKQVKSRKSTASGAARPRGRSARRAAPSA